MEIIEKLPGLEELIRWARTIEGDSEIAVSIGLDEDDETAFLRLKQKPAQLHLVATREAIKSALATSMLFFAFDIPEDLDPSEAVFTLAEFLEESGFLVTTNGDPSVKIGIAIDSMKFIVDMGAAALTAMNNAKEEHDPEKCEDRNRQRTASLPQEAVRLDFSTARYEAHLWFNGIDWVYNIRDTEADNYSLERGRSPRKEEVLAAAKACIVHLETDYH